MTPLIFLGHFLLRNDAARLAGVPPDELVQRPDLLRIGGQWFEEVYFGFQFDATGINAELGRVVSALRGENSDRVIADWLVRASPRLGGVPPLRWLLQGRAVGDAISAAVAAGLNPRIS